MTEPIDLEKLKPSDIVEVEMDEDRIIYIIVKHPVLNAKVDYEVAAYLVSEQKRLERTHGKATAIFIDVTDYKRLDATSIFGMTAPTLKTRRMHAEVCKNGVFKRVALYKKNASNAMKACVKIVSLSNANTEARVFTDKKRAIKWLKESAKEILKSERS